MNIGPVAIGEGFPCRTVAEISNNHNGDRDRCGRLIDAAQAAGADLVKFQCYTPDELVTLRGDGPAPEPWGSQGWTMRTLYEQAATPLDWFPKIAAHCARVGMPWFSSVFGLESLACLEAVGCPAYKVASLDREAAWLRRALDQTGKPVLLSVPDQVSEAYEDQVDGLLYCPPGYPTSPGDVHLPLAFHDYGYLGISSHCLAPELPIAAMARGAKLIEMHFMLADEPSALESNISLTESQWAAMVRSIRATEEILA